ncbi:MAG TPA: hypothetical protein VFK06_14850 [Candidatus Angelobacter sp.]|nr:hypothetical protein [Candidatus Angelobacter sp.]
MHKERPRNILLTVGTNPLPVLVAAWRLACEFEPQTLWLLHSVQTEMMAQAIAHQMRRRWEAVPTAGGTIRMVPISDAAHPKSIASTVRSLIPEAGSQWHLHYTGGTKIMALKAMQALTAAVGDPTDSYLDVNRHNVLDQRGYLINPRVSDERREWNLDLRDLCVLHGFTTDFRLEHRHKSPADVWTSTTGCFGEAKPEPVDFCYRNNGKPLEREWEAIGSEIFSLLINNPAPKDPGLELKEAFNSNWGNRDRLWLSLPSEEIKTPVRWPSITIPDSQAQTEWAALPARINKLVTEFRWNDDLKLERIKNGPSADLRMMWDFVNGADMEMAVHKSVRTVLEKRGLRFSLAHSVHIARRPKDEKTVARRCFELDVAVILGYQLVVISCSRSGKERAHIKNKAFEALHRARQVGGDSARALLICGLSREDTADLEVEVNEETGLVNETPGYDVSFGDEFHSSGSLPTLRIWPREKWSHLEESFDEYLDTDLKWRN